MKINLSLHIDELTQTEAEQTLVPFLMTFAYRGFCNNDKIDWNFNVSCTNFKLEQETQSQEKVYSSSRRAQ